ncbi:MAG: glycosyltransferase family 39 protein [Anaerolineales bacterium]
MSTETRRDLFRLTLILLVAAFLRFRHLGGPSFWLDEAYTWYLTFPSWREVWGVMMLISDTSPLHYLATRLTVPFFGRSEFALRFVALSAALLALPVVYRVGRTMFNRRVGLIAALLLALSPFAVWYARDARPYGFYLLFAALALWGFWRWAEEGRGPWLFVSSSAALYLAHYASALFAFAQAGYILMGLRRNPLLFRRWFVWQTLAALPTAIYALIFLLRRQPLTANTWIPRPGLLAPAQTLINFLSAEADGLTWLGALIALSGGMLLILGLQPCGSTSARAQQGAARRLLLWWLLLPMLAAWLLSFRLPAYVDRFFFPEIIALGLLLSAGLVWLVEQQGRLAWAQLALGLSALLACGGMLAISLRLGTSPRYAKEDWRGAARYITTQLPNAPLLAQDGEVLLGLLPYRPGQESDKQALPENLDSTNEPLVVVLRSLKDSNHALSKTAPFDPLTESPLADWFAAHRARVVLVQRFTGIGVVVVMP